MYFHAGWLGDFKLEAGRTLENKLAYGIIGKVRVMIV